MKPRCVLIWSDIGPYHAARSRLASAISSLSVKTVEILGRAGFAEFRALSTHTFAFSHQSLGLMPPLRAKPTRKALHDLLDRLMPQVVFTPGWSMLESLLTVEWCTSNQVPFVMMSDSTRNDAPRSFVKEHLKRRMVAMAAAAFVGGTPQAEYAAELGVPRDNIFVGYDIVDNEYFEKEAARARGDTRALRAEHRLPEKYFFCCARLVEKKNISRLVQAFAKYRALVGAAAWDLVVVGPGPLQDEIACMVASLGLDKAVHLLGARDYASLPIYYGLSSAFVLPSTTEQWGLVVNEAMASGLPVLVSARCGCARDLVEEGRNGFTFDPFDVNAMACVMQRMSSHDIDRATMSKASQLIIARWGDARFTAGFDSAAHAALSAAKKNVSAADRLLLRALISR